MKNIIKFVQGGKGTPTKIFAVLSVLHTIFGLPAFFFHEACHFIIAALCGVKITIREFKFFKYTKLEDGNASLETGLACSTKSGGWLQGVLIAGAPIIGIIGLLIWNFFLPPVYSMCLIWYMIICSEMFRPSEQDLQTILNCLRIRQYNNAVAYMEKEAKEVLGMERDEFMKIIKEDPNKLKDLFTAAMDKRMANIKSKL